MKTDEEILADVLEITTLMKETDYREWFERLRWLSLDHPLVLTFASGRIHEPALRELHRRPRLDRRPREQLETSRYL